MPQLRPPGWIRVSLSPGNATHSQTRPSSLEPGPALDHPAGPRGARAPPLTERHQNLAGQSSWQPSTPRMTWHNLCPSELCLCARPLRQDWQGQHSSDLGQCPLPPCRDRLPTHAAESCPGVPLHGTSEQLITASRAQIRAASGAPHSPWEQPGPPSPARDASCKGCTAGASAGTVVPGFPQAPKPCFSQALPHCSSPPDRPLQQGGQRDAGGGGKSSRKALWGGRQSRSHHCWQQSSKQKVQSFHQAKFGARVPPSAERGQDESQGAGAAPRPALAAREGRAGERREPLRWALEQAVRVQLCL